MARLARPRRIRRIDVVAAIVAIDRIRHVERAAIGAILAVDKTRRLCDRLRRLSVLSDRLSGRILLLHRLLHGLPIDGLSLLYRLLIDRLLIDRLRRRLLHRLLNGLSIDGLLRLHILRLLRRILRRKLLPCRNALTVLVKRLIVSHKHLHLIIEPHG